VLSDPIMNSIRGADAAQAVISVIQSGCAAPDELHEALHAVVGAGDSHLLRAFSRQLQKALERAAANV
jgi:hypothetical protein